jgi:hypothetical protein
MEDVKAILFQRTLDMQSDINAHAIANDDLHSTFWNNPPAAECPCPGDCFAIAEQQGSGGPDDYGCRLQFHRDSSQFVAFKQMELEATATSVSRLKTGSSVRASASDAMQVGIARIPGYTRVTTTVVSGVFINLCAAFMPIVWHVGHDVLHQAFSNSCKQSYWIHHKIPSECSYGFNQLVFDAILIFPSDRSAHHDDHLGSPMVHSVCICVLARVFLCVCVCFIVAYFCLVLAAFCLQCIPSPTPSLASLSA